jgi:hypothetical protein
LPPVPLECSVDFRRDFGVQNDFRREKLSGDARAEADFYLFPEDDFGGAAVDGIRTPLSLFDPGLFQGDIADQQIMDVASGVSPSWAARAANSSGISTVICMEARLAQQKANSEG